MSLLLSARICKVSANLGILTKSFSLNSSFVCGFMNILLNSLSLRIEDSDDFKAEAKIVDNLKPFLHKLIAGSKSSDHFKAPNLLCAS